MTTFGALPPGTRPTPLIGDTREFSGDPLGFLTRLHREHGDVAAWSLGPRRQEALFHPHDVARVLTGTNTLVRKGFGGGFPRHADLVGTNGLASSEGALWQRQRRIVQPGMHPRRVAGYATTMIRYARDMVDGWHAGEARDLHGDMVRLTRRIAVRTLRPRHGTQRTVWTVAARATVTAAERAVIPWGRLRCGCGRRQAHPDHEPRAPVYTPVGTAW